MDEQKMTNSAYSPEISMDEIMAFGRKNGKRIGIIAACTLVFTLLLVLVVYCFMPRERGYQHSISLTLPSAGNSFCYPNEKKFSAADVISRPVLRKVYADLNLKDKVTFEKFAGSIYIAKTDMKRAILDAKFRARMNARNINVVQLGQLEQEYREAVEALKTSQVIICMSPEFSVDKVLAARILNAIPEAWFDIYSVQEAKLYPSSVPVKQVQDLARMIGQDSQLILLEKSRQYCRQLMNLCEFLDEMLQDRNIMLPNGESLGDLQDSLIMLERYQINMLQTYILEHPELHVGLDRVFLESLMKDVENDLTKMKGKYDGVVAALDVLVADGVRRKSASVAEQKIVSADSAKQVGTSPVAFQLDAGFFDSIAQLIRKDINSSMRRVLADKTVQYREKLAELEAEYARYQKIFDVMNGKKGVRTQSSISKDKYYAMVREMISELFVACGKVKQIRDMILVEENSSRQFCTQGGTVRAFSSPVLPMARVALGLIAVWLLGNAGYIFFLFLGRKKN